MIDMTIEEIKQLIESAKSVERECKRLKDEIERLREELLGIGAVKFDLPRVMASGSESPQERVYFKLENLYNQYSSLLQAQYERRDQIEKAIAALDPLEQEIVRAWADGKTEEQIGVTVGYSWRTVHRYKKRILLKMSNIPS